ITDLHDGRQIVTRIEGHYGISVNRFHPCTSGKSVVRTAPSEVLHRGLLVLHGYWDNPCSVLVSAPERQPSIRRFSRHRLWCYTSGTDEALPLDRAAWDVRDVSAGLPCSIFISHSALRSTR